MTQLSGCFSKLVAIVAAFFRNWWRIIFGQGIYQTLNWLYDNPIWMLVEARFELKGVVAMMIGALVMNFCNLFYHRKKKISWLGIDQTIESVPVLRRLNGKLNGRAKEIVAFLVLSLVQDSFIATAYLRHGRDDGLKGKDLAIFFSSSVISISYWAIRNGLIIETARSLLKS